MEENITDKIPNDPLFDRFLKVAEINRFRYNLVGQKAMFARKDDIVTVTDGIYKVSLLTSYGTLPFPFTHKLALRFVGNGIHAAGERDRTNLETILRSLTNPNELMETERLKQEFIRKTTDLSERLAREATGFFQLHGFYLIQKGHQTYSLSVRAESIAIKLGSFRIEQEKLTQSTMEEVLKEVRLTAEKLAEKYPYPSMLRIFIKRLGLIGEKTFSFY